MAITSVTDGDGFTAALINNQSEKENLTAAAAEVEVKFTLLIIDSVAQNAMQLKDVFLNQGCDSGGNTLLLCYHHIPCSC